ncbi:MAG: addiction module protein [Desulfobulbaceae bacterium]|nr:addiction module protein [Desulfobulbaceae bacterium]
MTEIAQEILKKALCLSPVERAKLIDDLFYSFDNSRRQKEIDKLWAEEAESRINAYEEGKLTADSAEAVLERING